MCFVVGEAGIDCHPLGIELCDARLGVTPKRFFALHVCRKRCVEPIEFRQPPHDRVAARPRRRQFMRKFGRPLARLRKFVTALGQQGRGLVLRLLELTHQKREDMYTRYTNMK